MSALARVDAHQHFWQVSRGDYGWLEDAPDILRQDYLPDQLFPELEQAAITATVLVQAAPTVQETDYLIRLADQTSFIKGVVGWVDVSDAHALGDLNRLARSPLFKGVRPMLQDIDDPRWLIDQGRPEIFAALIDRALSFDALIVPEQLPTLIDFVGRYPELRVVVDHAAKPAISGAPPTEWQAALRDLSQSPNVFCKVSGLVTEVEGNVTQDVLQPYVDALVDMFSPARLIWGSDWPVLTMRLSYGQWLSLSEALLSGVTATDRQAIYGKNASAFYRLDLPS